MYVGGPSGLIDAVKSVHAERSLGRFHTERFHGVPADHTGDRPFDVQLGEDGPIAPIPAGQSITAALAAAGYPVPFSCEEGVCGTCQTTILAGVPDHRDDTLDEDEYADGEMLNCVSRSRSPMLVLDMTP